MLADAKLIAEAWDAAGLYQVGSFPSRGRWAEWNGRFRDDVRRFVRGDAGLTRLPRHAARGQRRPLPRRGRAPVHSINFVTCHDGFTLADLVSLQRQAQLAPTARTTATGTDDNLSLELRGRGARRQRRRSWRLRRRQQRNFLALLFLSQGVPMLLAGDELGRSQGGNNNAYCQDNEICWVDWSLAERNAICSASPSA